MFEVQNMDYQNMKRKDLQALCKKHNLRANGTNLEMADRLASLLKKPEAEPKKAVKSMDGNGSKVVKKVTFSGEQIFHDVDDNVRQTRGRRESVVKIDVPKTRSRKGKEVVGLVSSPVEMKKPRRGEKGIDDVGASASTQVEETGGRITRFTRRMSLGGGGVDVKLVENDSPVKTRRGKAATRGEDGEIVVRQTRSRKPIEQDDVKGVLVLSLGNVAEMATEEPKIGEEKGVKTRRGRANKKSDAKIGSVPIVVNDAQMAEEESSIGEERVGNTRRGRANRKTESVPSVVEEGVRQTRSRRNIEQVGVKGVSSLSNDAQMAKEESENGAELKDRDSKRSKKSKGLQKPELVTERSKRTSTSGNATESVEEEPGKVVNPEPAPRRSRRTATTIEKSVVEEPPRRNLKRKSIAPINVVVEEPWKRVKQTTTRGEVDNVEAREGGGKAKKLPGEVEVLVDIPSKRHTRHGPNAVESGVAVSGRDDPPNIEVKEKVLKQKGGTVKSKRGAKKPSAKGRQGKNTSQDDDDQDVDVSRGLDEATADTNAEKVDIQGDESFAITEQTYMCSAGKARVEFSPIAQDNSDRPLENVEIEPQNVALRLSDHVITEEAVKVECANESKEEELNSNADGVEPVVEQIDEYGQTDSLLSADHHAPGDIPLCYSDVKDEQRSSAKSIIRSNEYTIAAEAKESMVDAYVFSAEASSKERHHYQEKMVLEKTPLSSKDMNIQDGVQVSLQEDEKTDQKKLLLSEGLDKSNSRSGKSSLKVRQLMNKGSEQKSYSKQGFEVSAQQSSQSLDDIQGLGLETVAPGDVQNSPVSVGLLVDAEKGNSPVDHSLSESDKLNTNYRFKNDEDMDTVSPFTEDAYRNIEDGQTGSSVDSGYSTRAMKGFSDSSMSNKSAKAVEAKEMLVGALEYSAEASSKGKSVQSVRANQEHIVEIQSYTQFQDLEETLDCQVGTEVVEDETLRVEDETLRTSEAFSSPEAEDKENPGATEHNPDSQNSIGLFEENATETLQSFETFFEHKKNGLPEMHGHSDVEWGQNIFEAHQDLERDTVNSNQLSGEFVAENTKMISRHPHTSSPSDVKEEFFPALSNIEEAEIVAELEPEGDVDSVDKEDSEFLQQLGKESPEVKIKVQGVHESSEVEYDKSMSNERSLRGNMHSSSQASTSTEEVEKKEVLGETEDTDFDNLEDKDAELPQSSEGVLHLKKSDPPEMHDHADVALDQHSEGDTKHLNQLSGEFVAEKHENVSLHSHSMFQLPKSSEELLQLKESDPLGIHGDSDAESGQHSEGNTTQSNHLSGEFVAEYDGNVSPHSHSMLQLPQSSKEFCQLAESDPLEMHDHSDVASDQCSEEDTTQSNGISGEFVAEINDYVSLHSHTSSPSNVTGQEFFFSSRNIKEEEKVEDLELEGGVGSDRESPHRISKKSVELEKITLQGIYKSIDVESNKNMSDERKIRRDIFYHNSEASIKMSRFEDVEKEENATVLVEEFDKEHAKETTTLMFQDTQGSPLAQTPKSVKETEVNVGTTGHDSDSKNSDLLKKLKESCFEDMPGHAIFEPDQHFAKAEGCIERDSDPIGSTSVVENDKSSEAKFSETYTPVNLEDKEVTSSPTTMEEYEMEAELEANWGSENDFDFDEENRDANSSERSAEITGVLCALEREMPEQSEIVIENSDEKISGKEEASPAIAEYTVDISEQAVQEPAKQEHFSLHEGGEMDGCSLSVSDYTISGFCESEVEHVIEAFPETVIDSSSRCLIFHRERVTRCQGDYDSKNDTVANELTTCDVGLSLGNKMGKAGFTPNSSYGKSLKGKELRDSVSEVQVEYTDKLEDMADTRNVGASTPQLTPWEVGLLSGDDSGKERAVFTPNSSYGKSIKGRELSETASEVQVENTGKDMEDMDGTGTSTLHLTPSVVGLFSGDNTAKENAAFTHNRSYGKSLKRKELSDSAPKVEVEDAGNKLEDMDDTENASASTLHHDKGHGLQNRLALFEEGCAHDRHNAYMEDEKENLGSTLRTLFAAEETEISGTMPELPPTNDLGKDHTDENVCIREEEDMNPAMRMLSADAEASVLGTPSGLTIKDGAGTDQAEVADLDANVHGITPELTIKNDAGTNQMGTVDLDANVHRTTPGSTVKNHAGTDQMDAVNGLLTNMYITTAVKEKRFRLCTARTPAKPTGRSQQLGLLASGMKENVMNSKLEQSANRQMEKSASKRRVLGDLQNRH